MKADGKKQIAKSLNVMECKIHLLNVYVDMDITEAGRKKRKTGKRN